jgi:hypothetical protein
MFLSWVVIAAFALSMDQCSILGQSNGVLWQPAATGELEPGRIREAEPGGLRASVMVGLPIDRTRCTQKTPEIMLSPEHHEANEAMQPTTMRRKICRIIGKEFGWIRRLWY